MKARRGDTVVFREIDREHPERETPAMRGKVTYLHRSSDQLGVAYDKGGTKVWVCIEDVEIRGVVF